MTKKLELNDYERSVDEAVIKLKGCEPHSLEWESAYAELYELVYPKITRICDKEVKNLRNNAEFRVSKHDYYSIALTDVLVKLVNDFNPEEHYGFMKIYVYRTKKAFINMFKKSINHKNKALTTGVELECSFSDKGSVNTKYIDEPDVLKETSLYKALREFAEVNPKGRILFGYIFEDRSKTTEYIMKEMGITEYSNTDRWRVHNIKTKFRKFLIEKGYTHLVNAQ